MKQTQRSKQQFFQRMILRWFALHRRDFSWRQTHDPYRILVSEIMLQQTQVSRVILKYPAFLKRFPTIQSLADASTRDVIMAWQGLGYNRRALWLRAAARQVVFDRKSRWPKTRAGLVSLTGVGQATAGSLLAFAFGQDASSLDVNIKRVLHRFFQGSEFPDWRLTEREFLELAESIVPRGRGYDWNQALMDFGSLQCTARDPKCLTCPLQTRCQAYPAILKDVRSRRKNWDRTEPAPISTPDTPNRIYRGRIIEALRSWHRPVTLARLAQAIKDDYSAADAIWLETLLGRLETEGFVALTRDQHRRIRTVSLP